MERVPLITVERTFCLRFESPPEQRVLIVRPDLPVPSEGWRDRTETVTVLRPDGSDFETTAQISLLHINFMTNARHLAKHDQRRSVTVSFCGLTSDVVPYGSKILISREIRDALLPQALA